MPYKTWVVGEEVLAADFNNYVQQQVIATFANAAARTSAILAPVDGMVTWVDDVARLEYYDAGAWQPLPIGFTSRAIRREISATNTFTNPNNAVFPIAADRTALTISFVKKSSTSKLIGAIGTAAELTSGVAQQIMVSLKVGATVYDCGSAVFETAVSRHAIVGTREILGVAAGTYTVEPTVRSAAAVVRWGVNDAFTYSIQESY